MLEVGKVYKVKIKDKPEGIYYCLLIFPDKKIGLKDPKYPQAGEGIVVTSLDLIESFQDITTKS